MKTREINKYVAESIASAINSIIKSNVLGNQFVRSDFVRALKIVESPYAQRVPTHLCKNENHIVKPVNGIIPVGQRVDPDKLYYFAVTSVTSDEISAMFKYTTGNMIFRRSNSQDSSISLVTRDLPQHTVRHLAKVLNYIKDSGILGDEFMINDLRNALNDNKAPYYNHIPSILTSVENDIIVEAGRIRGYKNRIFTVYKFKDGNIKPHMINSICGTTNGVLRPRRSKAVVKTINNSTQSCKINLSSVSDADLIAELRSRGIEVRATKKIVKQEIIEL